MLLVFSSKQLCANQGEYFGVSFYGQICEENQFRYFIREQAFDARINLNNIKTSEVQTQAERRGMPC